MHYVCPQEVEYKNIVLLYVQNGSPRKLEQDIEARSGTMLLIVLMLLLQTLRCASIRNGHTRQQTVSQQAEPSPAVRGNLLVGLEHVRRRRSTSAAGIVRRVRHRARRAL